MTSPTFGCADCWPDDADAAWGARSSLLLIAELIDRSHHHVMVLECPACGQRFLSVFREDVDWVNGEDPQYWTLLPLSADEGSRAAARKVGVAQLDVLAGGRRVLKHDWPSGAPARSYWAGDVGKTKTPKRS